VEVAPWGLVVGRWLTKETGLERSVRLGGSGRERATRKCRDTRTIPNTEKLKHGGWDP
jgi:hypothetical protein